MTANSNKPTQWPVKIVFSCLDSIVYLKQIEIDKRYRISRLPQIVNTLFENKEEHNKNVRISQLEKYISWKIPRVEEKENQRVNNRTERKAENWLITIQVYCSN